MQDTPVVTGWRCSVCNTKVSIDEIFSWRCPNSTSSDRHHVLELENSIAPLRSNGDANPYVAFQRYLAWDAFAATLGLDFAARTKIIRDLDQAVVKVAGVGFRTTPFARNDALSDALGFNNLGGVWIKDETNSVAGSQKARHLFTELLHLVTVELVGRAPWKSPTQRPALAIASCGNAAIAASTLARAVNWPIRVFVPEHADAATLKILDSLQANVIRCPRVATDQPGDPCVFRFREAIEQGCIPFGVQGPENAWCLDGGRTIGFEMAVVAEELSGSLISRMFVQAGGGAFVACAASGFFAGATKPRVHAVQTQGCAPLARAFEIADRTGGARNAGSRWSQCMWPWETTPVSLADGILDDETYDWVGACNAMADSGGYPIVASEQLIHESYALAHRVTNIDVSPTGSSGLAGLLAIRHEIADDERVIVIFSGVRRQ
jgi:threonine synthase